MGEEVVFQQLLEEAKYDFFLIQREASVLQAVVDAGAGAETELEMLKDQWFMKEHILRALASCNSIECRRKIKQLRLKLKAYIMQKKRAARKLTQIWSCTSEGLPLQEVLKGVKCRRIAFNRWLSHASPLQCQEALIVHKQVFKLLADITVLVKDVQKISSTRQQITGLKKAVDDTMNFLESNKSLITYWFSKVTPALDVVKLHFLQECSETNKDMQMTLNCVHTQNDGSTTQIGTFNVDSDVRSGESNQYKDAKWYRPVYSISCDSRKYRSPARKGIHPYILKNKSVLNCTNQYVTSKKGKEDHLYLSGSYERASRNHVTNITNAEMAVENASNYRVNIDYDIDAILKEFKVVTPISSLDDSCCESSDIEYIPDFKLDCSVILKDVRPEVQKAADMNSYDKDSTQFISDARGTLIPFAGYEGELSGMCPRTEEIETFDSKAHEYSCHTEGHNLPEEYVNEDYAKAMIAHHSLQEASAHLTVPLPWTMQFFECNNSDVPLTYW